MAYLMLDEEQQKKVRAQSRKPLTDEELPEARALGNLLRTLRKQAGYGPKEFCELTVISTQQLYRIEMAQRRTRESTLKRCASTLGLRLPDTNLEALIELLVATAGTALAPEPTPAIQAGIDRNRASRARRKAEGRRTPHRRGKWKRDDPLLA